MSIASVKSCAKRLLSATAAVTFLVIAIGPEAFADSCRISTPAFANMQKRPIVLSSDSGKEIRIRVRVANSGEERAAGFQHICPQIILTSYILFTYERPSRTAFHMFNVHGPLDIGFFSRDGELLSIQRMEPQSRDDPDAKYYVSEDKFMYALEAQAGFFESRELEAGKARLIIQ